MKKTLAMRLSGVEDGKMGNGWPIIAFALAVVILSASLLALRLSPELQNLSPLEVTLDKEIYNFGDNITITVKNVSENTVTFGSTAYGVYFEKWENETWTFYVGVAAEEMLVGLQPGENHQIKYYLGYPYYYTEDNILRESYYFSGGGKYRVVSGGWISRDITSTVRGYAEFTVNPKE